MENIDGKVAKTLTIFSNPDSPNMEQGGGPQGLTSFLSSHGSDEKANLYVEGMIAGAIGASVMLYGFSL